MVELLRLVLMGQMAMLVQPSDILLQEAVGQEVTLPMLAALEVLAVEVVLMGPLVVLEIHPQQLHRRELVAVVQLPIAQAVAEAVAEAHLLVGLSLMRGLALMLVVPEAQERLTI